MYNRMYLFKQKVWEKHYNGPYQECKMHFAPGFKDPQVYLRSVQRVLINELEKYRPKEMTLRKSDQEGEENVDE